LLQLEGSSFPPTFNPSFFLFLLDPSIKADINQWRIKLENYSTQELGKIIVYLDGTTQSCRFRECNMGNLICDAMVSCLQEQRACALGGRKEEERGRKMHATRDKLKGQNWGFLQIKSSDKNLAGFTLRMSKVAEPDWVTITLLLYKN
jgi:hypothetical protein